MNSVMVRLSRDAFARRLWPALAPAECIECLIYSMERRLRYNYMGRCKELVISLGYQELQLASGDVYFKSRDKSRVSLL